jgi:hypothetical protein
VITVIPQIFQDIEMLAVGFNPPSVWNPDQNRMPRKKYTGRAEATKCAVFGFSWRRTPYYHVFMDAEFFSDNLLGQQ